MATKKKAKPKKKSNVTPIPRPQRLPGMDDPAIQEIETAALDYAEKRDERQAILLDEVSLKEELLKLMKKHNKTHYEHGDLVVDVVHEEETVKVRKKRPKVDKEAA